MAAHPVRTCIGCGRARAQAELVRLALEGEQVRVDAARRLPGRGGYLCGPQCVEAAIKRKGFGRAFRKKASVDAEALTRAVAEAAKGCGLPLTAQDGKI